VWSAVALSVAALGATASTASARDYAGTALNIIPSGQYGGLPIVPQADDQARLYDGLTPKFGSVRNSDLFRFFKSEKLGTPGAAAPRRREAIPRTGVTIVRDRFNVPHITSRTTDGLTFAAGWVIAEDRGLLLEQARYNGRTAAIDLPNTSAITLVSTLKSFTPSAQTEREVARQTNVLRAAGPKGRALLHDIDVYVSGINAFYRSKRNPAKPWTRNDVYALNALKGQFLGEGGGDEPRRSMFLSGLQQRLGTTKGLQVFNDLRERDDPETPVTVPGVYRFQAPPTSRTGNVVIDNGSLGTSALKEMKAFQDRRQRASNILIASGRRSATGHPMFVGGPQIGYFYPGLTLEMDLKGPGVNVRGATSAPFPGYMLIGRGEDFAWTLTSAGLDIVDTYAETLCGGSDKKYMYRGQCRDMQFFDAGTLSGERKTFYRTVHGPVIGYGNARGVRMAISRKRSSYGRDTLDQLFFQDLTRGRIRSVRDFFRSANQTPQTFNSFYADDTHAGMFTSGRVPIRAPGVDPGLPTKGTGQYEWRGFAPFSTHPQGIDSNNGIIVNWNERSAHGYQAPDDNWSLGAEQRVQLLRNNLATVRRHTLATVTSAMNKAATQDVRAMIFTPWLAGIVRSAPFPDARTQKMVELLEAWRRRGGSRLDRNLDGKVDDPGAAIMDTAFDSIANAALRPVLGPQLDQFAELQGRFDLPPGGQYGGWHIYLDKDFRTLLGKPVKGRFAVRYCGAGSLAACRAAISGALVQAGDTLTAQQGPDPAAWRSDATRERIKFVPGLLPFTMRYTNRPTGIQQVITFVGHRPGSPR